MKITELVTKKCWKKGGYFLASVRFFWELESLLLFTGVMDELTMKLLVDVPVVVPVAIPVVVPVAVPVAVPVVVPGNRDGCTKLGLDSELETKGGTVEFVMLTLADEPAAVEVTEGLGTTWLTSVSVSLEGEEQLTPLTHLKFHVLNWNLTKVKTTIGSFSEDNAT